MAWTPAHAQRAVERLYRSFDLDSLAENWKAIEPHLGEAPRRDCQIIGGVYARMLHDLERKEQERKTDTEVATPPEQPSLLDEPPTRMEEMNWSDAFVVFWDAYPRKAGGKKATRELWRRLWTKGELPPLAVLRDAIEAQSCSMQWQAGMIPYPATWLRQGRWTDDLEPANPYAYERNAEVRSRLVEADRDGARRGDRGCAQRLEQYRRWAEWRAAA